MARAGLRRSALTGFVGRSHSNHAPAREIPAKVSGPPGQACVLKILIPKPESASSTTGPWIQKMDVDGDARELAWLPRVANPHLQLEHRRKPCGSALPEVLTVRSAAQL